MERLAAAAAAAAGQLQQLEKLELEDVQVGTGPPTACTVVVLCYLI